MRQSPSWIPLSNQKLMIDCLYRKPTNMDQYLQWDSHHHLSAKYSVINALTHRARTVCNKFELLQKEMDHVRKALTHCKYPKWAIDRVERRLTKPTSEESNVANNQGTACAKPTTNEVKTKGHIVIPNTQGLCKSIKKSVVSMAHRPTSKVTAPLKTSWFHPRIRTPWKTKVGPSTGSNVGTLHVMRYT